MDHLSSYLVLSAILFSLGLYTVITRRNAVAILMGVELILNAANINFVAFSKFVTHNLDGHLMSVFIIMLAAAEAAVALAIVLNLYNDRGHINVDEANALKQ
ncbi:MAG: NADH-quinone oxidoreductase subunit NuoK [Candidatus Marinimicrobia bacterium]|jgi:NADH-quinone oxidoreductase subunit K|nr:NADH-quinone oxidoreductase subunit NuoK [Candidatus Neomarinimicrobiota bacterium]MBT4033474.1 NADH-quinone oxidoreductase subunit NuoK [Candidatus Neomarinimicrobiota bacterium]MBT4361986.1 NADH-quinone oxidoreductase subunit NuoK [Candidatus Neomarinimicrobiota bacterium]MBT4713823.1 NADH-quinone oxidoreductase subunit NuoK [Candidatus Neomarinimicrobiota bacterium]MBT4945852.1 NADH-quinone oxidoreductase subunit NuoK [Candidatus Neomarinimicrobiota bacterium]